MNSVIDFAKFLLLRYDTSISAVCRCIVLIICLLPFGKVHPNGLKFYGMNCPIAQRTSYNVFVHHHPQFKDFFEIEFDMAIYSNSDVGYVVRCKDENSRQVFNLFFDPHPEDEVIFCLNQEEKSVLLTFNIDLKKLIKKHWFKVKMGFHLKENEVSLEIQGEKAICKDVVLPDTFRPCIVFGKSDHIIDVPEIAINHLRINSARESYVFALNETGTTETVFDTKGKLYGEVENPLWLADEAIQWKKEAQFHSDSESGVCYDSNENKIYYFNRDTLFTYNVGTRESTLRPLAEPCPVKLLLTGCFVDHEQQRLYVYETFHSDQYTGPMIASLQLETLRWRIESDQQLEMHLHHHDGFYNPQQKRQTIFGGFGNMKYSNRFYQIDIADRSWHVIDSLAGDVICPRYFSAVGYQDSTNTAYVFGGMGNESGEQIIGRKYLYDFYKVDFQRKRIDKLWDLTGCPTRKVPARGMILPNDSCFYVLCYPESVSRSELKLYRFSIKDGHYRQLADSIPILSDRITTNAHLYYNEELSKLFVTVQESTDDISSSLTIYSLRFPPATFEEHPRQRNEFAQLPTYAFLLLPASAVVLLLLGAAFRRSRQRRNRQQPPTADAVEEKTPLAPYEEKGNEAVSSSPSDISSHMSGEEAFAPNSVYLFGEFTMIDRNRHNISYLCTARVKQIFCLILRHSNSNGISSKQLSDLLWPDKPKDKVKNSRGVTINHLRKVLSELDGIELVYEKGCFRFVLSDDFHCDYQRGMEIIHSGKENECKQEFLRIIGRGKFLHSLDDPIFDSFKQDVECRLEAVLLKQIEEAFNAQDYPSVITLSEAEFGIDPLSERTLYYHLKSLFMLKRENAAITSYQKFIAEYKKCTGKDYPQSFRHYWC